MGYKSNSFFEASIKKEDMSIEEKKLIIETEYFKNAIIAINNLGFSIKTALSGMSAMSKVLSMESLNIKKKKKNWKEKTIWDREGI